MECHEASAPQTKETNSIDNIPSPPTTTPPLTSEGSASSTISRSTSQELKETESNQSGESHSICGMDRIPSGISETKGIQINNDNVRAAQRLASSPWQSTATPLDHEDHDYAA